VIRWLFEQIVSLGALIGGGAVLVGIFLAVDSLKRRWRRKRAGD
jgi:hypothetical protein